MQASVRQEGGRTVVDFPRTSVAPEVARRYDVVDFATPVSSFDVTSTPNGARIIVNATGDYEQLGYQSDREYVLELRQRPKAAAAADPGKKEYRGERLTLNFQDIETRAVLQLLAETSGQNIVVSDTVQGNVTLRLQNVPWDQALDIVMRTKGLDKRQEGNVIYVAPAEELAAREKQMLESQKSLTELAPVRTEYLQVNYAKASDLASLIKSQGKGSLLSDRGSLAIDERTNTLLLQDTADRLADIRRLVQTLDIPVKQVLIEARIVIVNDDFSRELGVRFGGAFVGNYGSNDGLMYVSNSGLNSADGYARPDHFPERPGRRRRRRQRGCHRRCDRYMVNLPIANPAGRLAMTLLDSDYVVDLEITAAQREGRGEVVSAPRVITANGKEAVIEQGTEIPYQESASSGATTTQFKKAVLSLKVTPQITPDDRVILDLTVSQGQRRPDPAERHGRQRAEHRHARRSRPRCSSTTARRSSSAASSRPSAATPSTRCRSSATCRASAGCSAARRKTDNKDELLIFVTPKILREGAEIY